MPTWPIPSSYSPRAMRRTCAPEPRAGSRKGVLSNVSSVLFASSTPRCGPSSKKSTLERSFENLSLLTTSNARIAYVVDGLFEASVLLELLVKLKHELSGRLGQNRREAQHLRGVVRDAVDVAVGRQHAAIPLEDAARQLVTHERCLVRARVEAQHLRGGARDAVDVAVGRQHAAHPLVVAHRQLVAHERRLLRARVEAQHLRGIVRDAVDVAVARQHAAEPHDVARQLVAHERRLLRARVKAQHLCGARWDAVDVAVSRQHAAVPLEVAHRQLVAHERRLLRARVKAQHLRGVSRDAVDVAVGRQHAAAPLVVASWQLVAHARRLLRAWVEAQHLRGVVRYAVDVSVARQHATDPLEVARQLVAHARRLLRAWVEAQHLRGAVRDAVDIAVGCQHAALPLVAARRQPISYEQVDRLLVARLSACKTPFHSTTKGASCPMFLPTPPSAVRSQAASFCSTHSGITFSSSSSRSLLLSFADPPSPFVLGAPVTNGSSLPASSSAGTGWTECDAAALLSCHATADCRSAASDSMKRKLSF
eukprot:scaffold13097_cov59-Phaeocystis_antarctica.AAC.6